MKKSSAVLLFLLLIVSSTFAQKVKFRKIEAELIQETTHKTDSEADAAVLYQYCRVYYSFSDGWFDLHTYVHKRIKIYNQEGMVWGDFAIPYHIEGRFVKFKAFTYNLENGEVVETKLENESYFSEEFNKIFMRRKFAMPNLAPGSVIDIEYELKEPSTISLRPFYLQSEIPIDYIEYVVETPEFFTFNKFMKGLPLPVTRKSDSKSGTLPSMGNTSSLINNNYAINIDSYKAGNVPALKEEAFVPSMDNYRSSVNFELSFIQGRGGEVKNFSSTWDHIAYRYMTGEKFGQQLDLRLNDLSAVVEKAMGLSVEERINYLYYYVRNNYNWNGNNGEYCEKGLKKLINEKSGNVADINFLLINLLKKAGINAQPVVISTRNNGFLNVSYPSYSQINYVFVAIKNDTGYSFLDATSKYLDVGFLPERALNLDGIVITDDQKGVKVTVENPNKGSIHNTVLTELNEDLTIKGQIRTVYNNYDAAAARSAYKEAENKGGYVKQLHESYPTLEIIKYTETGADSLQPKMVENIEFVLEGQVDQVGDMLYINPMLIWQDKTNYLKSETREFPVFYTSTGIEKHIISMKIPDGYIVETLPKAIRLVLPDGMGSFTYSVTASEINITLQCEYNKVIDIISPTAYDSLRSFVAMMIDKQAEKIVLKKI